AHRTSPTNIGLYLLATVAARDFGWLGIIDMIERLEATRATMGRMQRFRGHFFNWYDSQDLRPLEPRYVSSVDSGNLAGHLIALANACREWIDRPLVDTDSLAGIDDGLALLRECRRALGADQPSDADAIRAFDDEIEAVSARLREAAALLAGRALLAPQAKSLLEAARALAAARGAPGGDLLI